VLLITQVVMSCHGFETVFTSRLGFDPWSHAVLIFMNVFKLGQDYWQTLLEHIFTSRALGSPDAIGDFAQSHLPPAAFRHGMRILLVPQGWSLGTELTYFLVAPLVVAASWRRVVALGLASVAVRIGFLVTLSGAYMGCWRTKFFPSVLVFFLLG